MKFEYTERDRGCVPKDITRVRFNDGLQKIGNKAFHDCKSLKSITLPSTVTEIGIGAFHGCSKLRVVTLNEGLQKIGGVAFYNCKSIKRILNYHLR